MSDHQPGDASGPGVRHASVPQPTRSVVVAGVVVGVVAVSFSAILVRVADAHPLAIAFWRCALGAIVLAPFAARARRGAQRLERGQRLQLVGSGVFLALHFALWLWSLEFTTVASSVVLVAMAPLFVGVGAALFLREPPSRRTWVGLVAAMAGAVVIGASDLTAAALGRTALLGDGLALGGAVAMAGYLLIGRAARKRLPTTVYASAVYGVAALVLLAACVVTGVPLAGYDIGTWLAILAIVAGPQLGGHTVFNALLSTLTATTVAVVALAEPVGATLLAFLLLAESPSSWFWAGAPLILLGVYLASTQGRGRTARDPLLSAPPPG